MYVWNHIKVVIPLFTLAVSKIQTLNIHVTTSVYGEHMVCSIIQSPYIYAVMLHVSPKQALRRGLGSCSAYKGCKSM